MRLPMRGSRHARAALMMFWIAGVSAPALAQPRFQVTPLFSVAQTYDDNILFSAISPEADFITRVTPGLESHYDSPLFTLVSRYAFDAERFADHPALTAIDGHRASLEFHYKPTARVELSADGGFTRTRTPGELYAAGGLILARATAERFALHPAAKRQLDRNTVAWVDYSLRDDRLAGGARVLAQDATAWIERHRSARDTITFGYAIQHFAFEPALDSTSHAVTMGWSRSVSRETVFTLRGGPRVTDGRVAPDVSALVESRLRSVTMSLGYTQTQTSLIGLAGVAGTQNMTVAAHWMPTRDLHFRVAPGIFRGSGKSA